MTLKELLDFEFTANEDGEMIALVPLSKVNEIADILTNQKEKIDKAIKHIKENTKNDTFCEWYDGEVKDLLEILGEKE